MTSPLRVVLSSVAVACVCTALPSVGASASPLDEHRRSMRAPSQAAYVVTGSIGFAGNDGRVVLNIPSARLISAGVRSGDEVAISIGDAQPWNAYVEFRDELERNAAFYAQNDKELPIEPGMTLIVNRDQPGEQLMLDASAGGGVTPHDALPGRIVSIRAMRRIDAK